VHLLASYDFSSSSKPLYLRDLAIILKHIHDLSREYKLLKEQCYWFSRTCIGVAKNRCGAKETRTQYWETAGTYRFAHTKLKSAVTLPINKDQSIQVDKIAEEVNEDIQKQDEYVSIYFKCRELSKADWLL